MLAEANKEKNTLLKNHQKEQSFTTGVYVGRFQPFHDGHKKCIEHILKKHDKCVVILRETTIDDKNPFTIKQRREMIEKAFPERVLISTIPDISCNLTVYIGRGVGYGLIQLDTKTENISATDIRKKLYEKEKK